MANKHSLFYTETQVHKKAKTRQGKAICNQEFEE